MRILFITNTYHRGKKILLDLSSLTLNKNINLREAEKLELLKHLGETFLNESLPEIFLKKSSLNFNRVFDFYLENDRYISFHIFLDSKKYLNFRNSKSTYEANEEEDISGDEEENKKKILDKEERNRNIKLKSFNVVLIFERDSPLLKNVDLIYVMLESICK